MTLLTQGLLDHGHSVSVITFSGAAQDFFQLPEGAQRSALAIDKHSPTIVHGLTNNLRRLRVLRRAIKSARPDVVVSHVQRTNIMTLMAMGRSSTPVIVVEHNDPQMNPAGRIWDTLRRRTYQRASAVVSVSAGVDNYFSWLPPQKRIVIHNPINLPCGRPKPLTDVSRSDRILITSMGRLTRQKGFDLLLKAFAKIAPKYPQCELTIIGEGPLYTELERLSRILNLSSQVTFAGRLKHPQSVLQKAQLFVMASRFEGFPYAALEAMANGLPVIYTDCPSGPREIIRDGIDGLLVPNGDVSAIAQAMNRLISGHEERHRMAARAPEVLERFGLEKIVEQWEALFKVCSQGS